MVLPIVRGVKILDPKWQASALLIKLLVRGLTVGYEPWKSLVRFRVAQTQQSRRGKWPPHPNWIMNNRNVVKQGSPLWQGVVKAWTTMQAGLEQQDPTTWDEISRHPLFGNRFLTIEQGVQWETDSRTNLKYWAEKNIWTIKDIIQEDGNGWKQMAELESLRRSVSAPRMYAKILRNIPWQPIPTIPSTQGLWVAAKEEDGTIQRIHHITKVAPMETSITTIKP